MSTLPETRDQEQKPAPPPPPATEEAIGERSWKAWVVRFVLLVLLGAGLFTAGTLYGRWSDAAGPGARDGAQAAGEAASGEEILYWTCSMHPQIKLPRFGPCPICFMDLIPVRAGQGEDSEEPKLILSERARELARVQTVPVERRELMHEIRMVGKVTVDETRVTYVSSYIPGRLDRLYVDYTGILVKKGDHLAEIYSPDLLVAQREYLLALRSIEQARARGEQNEAAIEAAQALYDAARRKLELWGVPRDELERLARERRPSDHMRIDSPMGGWVLERQGFQGMYVETGTRIFTLADLRSVWVQLDAYELDLGYIRLAQEVEFETEAYPGQIFKGQVAYIDPVLNPDTRTVKVRVNVENTDLKLRPEMFVRARLKVRVGAGGKVMDNALAGKWLCYMHPEVVKEGPGKCDLCGMDLVPAESIGYGGPAGVHEQALAIPRTAVLWTGKRAVVYVEARDGKNVRYEGRTVQLGPRAGDSYVVIDGLREGERVVTRGALMIDSALQIQARPSMMQPGKDPEADAGAVEPAPGAPSHYVAGAMYHQHARPVVDGYLELTGALVANDEAGTKAALDHLRKALKGAVPHGLEGASAQKFQEQMAALAAGLPPADASVKAARNQLPEVTRRLAEYLKTFGHDRSEPMVVVFCPMAFDDQGASWLQADRQVRNPYFGRMMLRCGEVREQIDPDGSVTHHE